MKFVANIKSTLAAGDMKKAQELCDKQGGSVANVVTSTLRKYADVENDATLSKDQKVLAIQKELEEATALELPMMEQNLPVIGTITTLGTLMGLLGTVIGMIRSFAALSAGGGTDSMALSQGISEALINTAFGILTGASLCSVEICYCPFVVDIGIFWDEESAYHNCGTYKRYSSGDGVGGSFSGLW